MDIKKVIAQAATGVVLFTIISVILQGEYGQDVWVEKGLRGLFFGVLYAVFLVIKEKFIKK